MMPFLCAHIGRHLCGIKDLSLRTLLNIASAEVQSYWDAQLQLHTIPDVSLSHSQCKATAPMSAVKSRPREELDSCSEGFHVLPQFSQSLGKQVLLLAIASPSPYSSDTSLRSGLQLRPLSNAQHWYRLLSRNKILPISAETCWALQSS